MPGSPDADGTPTHTSNWPDAPGTLVARDNVIGTAAYAAPEVLEHGWPLDAEVACKADVYSFGVVVWELLTRQRPHLGMDAYQIQTAWMLDPASMALRQPELGGADDPDSALALATLWVRCGGNEGGGGVSVFVLLVRSLRAHPLQPQLYLQSEDHPVLRDFLYNCPLHALLTAGHCQDVHGHRSAPETRHARRAGATARDGVAAGGVTRQPIHPHGQPCVRRTESNGTVNEVLGTECWREQDSDPVCCRWDCNWTPFSSLHSTTRTAPSSCDHVPKHSGALNPQKPSPCTYLF